MIPFKSDMISAAPAEVIAGQEHFEAFCANRCRPRRRGQMIQLRTGKSASVQRSAKGRVFDCEFVAYPQLPSTFLRTRRITAKVPPTITVNRYAIQNIHLSFPCWMPVVASPMSAQPESDHKQENAGQDPAGDAAPE